MFDWFRKKKKDAPETPAAEARPPESEPAAAELVDPEPPPPPEAAATPDQIPEPAPAAVELEAESAAPDQASEFAPDQVAEPAPVISEPEPEAAIAPEPSEAEDAAPEAAPSAAEEALTEASAPKKGFFSRFRARFSGSEAPEATVSDEPRPEVAAEENPPAMEAAPETAADSETRPEPAPESAVIAEPQPEPPLEAEAVQEPSPEPPADATPEPEPAAPDLPEPPPVEAAVEAPPETPEVDDEFDEDEPARRKGLFARFKEKLGATRDRLAGRLETLLSSVRTIDDDLLDELEELLITADLGVATTNDLLFKIRGQVAKKELKDAAALKEALKKRICEMVDLPRPPRPEVKPLVMMVVGINGVGKTTTIAKLARRLKEDEGQKVLLAAGDTFRSAAVEQLTIWAERLGVDIVSQPTGADASAVVFDALTAAQARGVDVVIIDTAGRLHTKVNLMDELKKIKRVANKALPGAPHHTILVLDGNTGQNAQRQAQTFHEAVGVDSIVVTKLDGTAKGGVIVSIAHELKIPIAFVGLGESFDDLQPFDPQAFTEAILTP